MNAEISETIKAAILGLGMEVPEIPTQRKFVFEIASFPLIFTTLRKIEI